MPRISREAAAAKESFVLGLFAENPAYTMKEIQSKVKEKFGASMNATKIGQLRNSVASNPNAVATVEVATTVTTAVETSVATGVSGNENVNFSMVPAPAPISVASVTTQVIEVTDGTGTYIKPVDNTETVEKTKTIRPGLVEVVKVETQV